MGTIKGVRRYIRKGHDTETTRQAEKLTGKKRFDPAGVEKRAIRIKVEMVPFTKHRMLVTSEE